MLGGRRGFGPRADWQELFAAARVHIVVPSLGWCLRDEKDVPPEFRSYLDAVVRLNGKRNNRLCKQLEEIARALNDVDIEPILLKGAAHLVGDVYPSSAARLMGDLDILVPEQRAREAFAVMESIGFALDQPIADTHHHLPLMRHVENDIVIELHTRLLHERSEPIVPVSWVHEQSRLVPFHGLRVKIPPPTIMIAHNIVHDQLNHERYAWKQVELRQLLDFAIMRGRYESQIDWKELDRRFNDVGLGHVLATYLHYNKKLLGQPMPVIRSAPRKHAMRRLRHATEFPLRERPMRRAEKRAKEEARLQAEHLAREQRRQAREQRRHALEMRRAAIRNHCGRWARRVSTVATLPWYYINERRRDPRGLVRLLEPQTWVRRCRSIARNLKEMQ
jgi:Uncharacterised nucleotidyltransferase